MVSFGKQDVAFSIVSKDRFRLHGSLRKRLCELQPRGVLSRGQVREAGAMAQRGNAQLYAFACCGVAEEARARDPRMATPTSLGCGSLQSTGSPSLASVSRALRAQRRSGNIRCAVAEKACTPQLVLESASRSHGAEQEVVQALLPGRDGSSAKHGAISRSSPSFGGRSRQEFRRLALVRCSGCFALHLRS